MGGVDARMRAVQGRRNPYGISPSEGGPQGSRAIRKGCVWGQEAWRKAFARTDVTEKATCITC